MKQNLLRLATLVSSLSMWAWTVMDDRNRILAVLLGSPALVLALAVLLIRTEPFFGRVVCSAIAIVAGLQLTIVALHSTVLSDPSGLGAVVWPLALGPVTTALAAITFVAQPAVLPDRTDTRGL